jgi:nitric oxide reductase NorF protein
MQDRNSNFLIVTATGMMLVTVSAALVAAQWKHQALPFVALAAVLVMTVITARWLVLDYMHLRNRRPRLSVALIAWSGFFAAATAVQAAFLVFAG